MTPRNLISEAAARVQDAFHRELDKHIVRALQEGKRLAVSSVEYEAIPVRMPMNITAVRWLFVLLDKDEPPPTGHSWTVYEINEPPQ